VATSNFRLLPSTTVALSLYSVTLLSFVSWGYFLYSSGQKTAAKGFMLGLAFNLIGIAICTFLAIKASILGGMIFAVISSLSSQILDPSSLEAALAGALAAMYVALGIGLAALIYVPEPSSITFRSVFPLVNLIFAQVSVILLESILK
jgi:hypothetical protein